MDAKDFIELDSVSFEDVTFRQGDTIKIHIEVLYKIMEEYHQSKVNSFVLDDVNKSLEPTEKQCYKSFTGLGVKCKEHCGSSIC